MSKLNQGQTMNTETAKEKLDDAMDDYLLACLNENLIDMFESSEVYLAVRTNDENLDPLDVVLCGDSIPKDKVVKLNLREEYLDIFSDDPKHYKDKMPKVISALRNLADEIEQIYNNC